MSFEKWGGGEGLCLHSLEGQTLCVCAAPEELIFNTSGQHQTVDLSVLPSETMWYQPIFIELLVVLLLLQEHMHFFLPYLSSFPPDNIFEEFVYSFSFYYTKWV
jgi:hypothetical protein